MTTTLAQTLDDHARRRDLVSISREELDANDLHGYVLGVSPELVILHCEYDFRLDGLVVLRLGDITEVRCTTTNAFQNELLLREGVTDAIDFAMRFGLDDWRAIIAQLSREHDLVILECEGSNGDWSFSIGRVRTLSDTCVTFDTFDGVGLWNPTPREIDLADITACRVDTSYANAYRRHFARQALS